MYVIFTNKSVFVPYLIPHTIWNLIVKDVDVYYILSHLVFLRFLSNTICNLDVRLSLYNVSLYRTNLLTLRFQTTNLILCSFLFCNCV